MKNDSLIPLYIESVFTFPIVLCHLFYSLFESGSKSGSDIATAISILNSLPTHCISFCGIKYCLHFDNSYQAYLSLKFRLVYPSVYMICLPECLPQT